MGKGDEPSLANSGVVIVTNQLASGSRRLNRHTIPE